MTRLSIGFIHVYRATLGPVFGLFSSCRFQPTCSEYGMLAIRRFGWRRGWLLALHRVGRCHPWGGHGYDPIPDEYLSRRERRRREAASATPGSAT